MFSTSWRGQDIKRTMLCFRSSASRLSSSRRRFSTMRRFLSSDSRRAACSSHARCTSQALHFPIPSSSVTYSTKQCCRQCDSAAPPASLQTVVHAERLS